VAQLRAAFEFRGGGAGVTTDKMETSIPAASIASTRPWPMSSSRAWLSPISLKATLSSRAAPWRRSSASRMLALFQCSSIAMIFTFTSSGGGGPLRSRPTHRLLSQPYIIRSTAVE
jgi:hypothetical protein